MIGDTVFGVLLLSFIAFGAAWGSYKMALQDAKKEFQDLRWWELLLKIMYWLGAIFIGALFLPAVTVGMSYNFEYTIILFVIMTISALWGWYKSSKIKSK